MGNYFHENKRALRPRHYPLRANAEGYWFNVSPNRLDEYRKGYGDSFCLIFFRTGPVDDAYVIPYGRIKHLLIPHNLVPGSGNTMRWMGSIVDGELSIRGAGASVEVADCHNAHRLL